MSKILLLVISVLVALNLQSAPTTAVLFSTNPSIVKVHVANKDGNHGVGSGVVVAKDYIVTNCHVIADAQGVHVEKYGVSYPPEALIANWKNDLCILKFKYTELKPAVLGTTENLQYETNVFTKSYGGNSTRPQSSFGSIKGIFNFNGFKVIQSSASFTMGASGGGLFNEKGELLGITTVYLNPRGKAYYFSMSVEMIKSMLKNGDEISVTTQSERPFWDNPEESQPFFMQVAGPIKNKMWGKLENISQNWLTQEPDSDESNFYYALSQYYLNNLTTAQKVFKKIIKQNKRHTESYLYLYKIAKKSNMKKEMQQYKSLTLSLDETLIIEIDE